MNVFNMDDFDKEFEDKFRSACNEYASYGSRERTTLDNEWTHDELHENVYDVCIEYMTDKVLSKYKNKALINQDLLKPQYMADRLISQTDDLVELYNSEYDKHRNEKCFGIVWFDEAIKRMITKELRENVVCR